MGLKILTRSSWTPFGRDGQALASTDRTRSAQGAESVMLNSALPAATFGSVTCLSQSTMVSCFQGKTVPRTSGSNDLVTLVGSSVLGRGPSVGMIAPPVLEFKKVRVSESFMILSGGPLIDTTSASNSCDRLEEGWGCFLAC